MKVLLFHHLFSDYGETSFLASFDSNPGTPTDPIVFNIPALNPGDHYNASSGYYTVPIDGVYEFSFHIWVVTDSGFDAYLVVDGVQVFCY